MEHLEVFKTFTISMKIFLEFAINLKICSLTELFNCTLFMHFKTKSRLLFIVVYCIAEASFLIFREHRKRIAQ